MDKTGTHRSTVLIVDDEPIARDMMEGFLNKEGYRLTFAGNGPETLAQVAKQIPDLILLDVMMPEMDGFEVCRRLKADKRWRHIPIILVTALGGTDDLVRGLDAGGDDFLSKPVNSLELQARMRSMLRIKKQYDELETTLRLREDLTHMIVHDIRTPLTAILGYSQMLLARNALSPIDAKDVDAIQMQAYRLDAFLNDMLILAKLEAEKLILNRSMVNVNQLIQQVKESYEVMALSKKVKLCIDLPAEFQHVLLDANLFQRVLENLLSNALKFSPSESTVTIQVEYPRVKTMLPSAGPRVRVKFFDQGPGITADYQDRIFDKFEIASLNNGQDPQIGLGLAFCRMVVEAHGGYIFVQANKPEGSIFTVEV
ncbi:MAG: response regulator [Anaerolineae bacterium]|nr:response regulator [Anaerolineae bacterium]